MNLQTFALDFDAGRLERKLVLAVHEAAVKLSLTTTSRTIVSIIVPLDEYEALCSGLDLEPYPEPGIPARRMIIGGTHIQVCGSSQGGGWFWAPYLYMREGGTGGA